MESLLQFITLLTIGCILAASIALLTYYIPRIRRRAWLQDEENFCDSCGGVVDGHSPFGCASCLTWLCSGACKARHMRSRHGVTARPRPDGEAA